MKQAELYAELTHWEARALKAEADRVSAQTNADELLADLREAEEALRVVLDEKSNEACRLIDMANNANLRANKAEEALAALQNADKRLSEDVNAIAEKALRADKAEEALREIIRLYEQDEHANSMVAIARAALSEKGE